MSARTTLNTGTFSIKAVNRRMQIEELERRISMIHTCMHSICVLSFSLPVSVSLCHLPSVCIVWYICLKICLTFSFSSVIGSVVSKVSVGDSFTYMLYVCITPAMHIQGYNMPFVPLVWPKIFFLQLYFLSFMRSD